jgi:hypothetical protein
VLPTKVLDNGGVWPLQLRLAVMVSFDASRVALAGRKVHRVLVICDDSQVFNAVVSPVSVNVVNAPRWEFTIHDEPDNLMHLEFVPKQEAHLVAVTVVPANRSSDGWPSALWVLVVNPDQAAIDGVVLVDASSLCKKYRQLWELLLAV